VHGWGELRSVVEHQQPQTNRGSQPATPTSRDGVNTLAVRELVKHFGHVKANDGLNLEFAGSEVHALLGENGAGKSTLIKILAGVYQPDSGTILLNGVPLELPTAMEARRHGIGVVHQDSMLIPGLTVRENVVLQEGSLGRVPQDLGARLAENGERLGFKLDPNAIVESLTPGDRQRVEIARALMMNARFLILDEPTSVLSPQEKLSFFGVLKGLAADGIGVVVVTHHISEALQHSERVTILRAGNVVGDARKPSKELSKQAVTQMMVGEVDFAQAPRDGVGMGDVVVKVTDLSGQLGSKRLESINLSVRAGEVLGIAGVEGDGQRELAAALTGAWKPETGTVELEGRNLSDYAAADRTRMIADVPDDQLLGTIAEISVWENIGLTRLAWQESPTPWRCQEIRAVAKQQVKEFGIRTASLNSPVGLLSGGNRRRVVIARELSKQPTLAVLTFATKGLDVRSVAQVQEWTRKLASGGTAVIYISADLEEVLTISDRIAVLAHGEIRGILDAEEATVERIGHLMLGASSESVTA
jgi:ABC-type uncharacterized transport system ATPase subunit